MTRRDEAQARRGTALAARMQAMAPSRHLCTQEYNKDWLRAVPSVSVCRWLTPTLRRRSSRCKPPLAESPSMSRCGGPARLYRWSRPGQAIARLRSQPGVAAGQSEPRWTTVAPEFRDASVRRECVTMPFRRGLPRSARVCARQLPATRVRRSRSSRNGPPFQQPAPAVALLLRTHAVARAEMPLGAELDV